MEDLFNSQYMHVFLWSWAGSTVANHHKVQCFVRRLILSLLIFINFIKFRINNAPSSIRQFINSCLSLTLEPCGTQLKKSIPKNKTTLKSPQAPPHKKSAENALNFGINRLCLHQRYHFWKTWFTTHCGKWYSGQQYVVSKSHSQF